MEILKDRGREDGGTIENEGFCEQEQRLCPGRHSLRERRVTGTCVTQVPKSLVRSDHLDETPDRDPQSPHGVGRLFLGIRYIFLSFRTGYTRVVIPEP